MPITNRATVSQRSDYPLPANSAKRSPTRRGDRSKSPTTLILTAPCFCLGLLAMIWWGFIVDTVAWESKKQASSSRELSDGSSPAVQVANKAQNFHGPANSRIKGLLEIVDSASSSVSEPSWPSYIQLHRVPRERPTSTEQDPQACIVTAYFRVRSKFSPETYENDWMENMLSIHECMVIFCEPSMVDTMKRLRSSVPAWTVVLAMDLNDLPVASYSYNNTDSPTNFWENQLQLDPEKKLHKSYQLFWIWLSKTWFVTTAAVLQQPHLWPFRVEQWMWADIGSFRGKQYRNRTIFRATEAVYASLSNTTILWMAHHRPDPPADPFWNRKLRRDEKHHFYHSGSHGFGITVAGWVGYYRHFCSTLDGYAQRGLFLGEDQCVLQTTCLVAPPSFCAYLPFDQVPDNRYFGLRYALQNGVGKNGASFRPWQKTTS